MPTCTACATETEHTGLFCPECGAALRKVDASAATAELAPANTLIGKTIDGFVIDDILGGGAFGTVFRGRQLGLDRPVALKVPSFEILADATMAKRFAREARSAAKINHPGVVGIYAVGELPDGRPYLAMQLLDGQPLDKILEDGPVAAPRALAIVRDIASALSETHHAGVVHRDLKPANIMWRRDRHGDDRITIVDFGIAVAKPGNADATRLTTNGLIGTPHYMSPEQAQGEHADQRSDLYALGCILFELVTAETPFEGSGFEVLLAHMGRPIPTPSDRVESIPAPVDQLVRRLMQKRPDNRPQTADELITLIDDALGELANKRSGALSLAKTMRRKRATQHPTLEDIAELEPEPIAAPRISRARMIALAVMGSVAIALGGAVVYKLAAGDPPRSAAATSSDAGVEDSADPSPFTGRRVIISDDGEMIARTTVYDPIVAGTRTRTMFELWNAIGAALDAPQLVVTIEGPDGTATGVTAKASTRTQGRYAFTHVFPAPGHYILRVFPPEAHSMFEIDLDVEAR